MPKQKMSVWGASAFVIANMIGTGVFCSLGFQLVQLHSASTILLLWFVGGLIAFCGALSYSELGSAMPRSGGEYHYLSQIYHPLVGFLSGFTSLFVGFAAPVAIVTMALSSYVCGIWPALNPMWLGLGVLTVLTLVHLTTVHIGTLVQEILTVIKILIILAFIIAGFIAPTHADSSLLSGVGINSSEIFSMGFGISLIWVYYAYSGWNAAAYISNDIERPQVNVPRSLLISTGFVILLYLLLNFVFLRSTPMEEMVGQVEIGLISANHIFGVSIGRIVGLLIAAILMSSISSMIFVGARVSMVMGEDHKILGFLKHKTGHHENPTVAILFQWLISALLIITSSFELVTTYTGVLLSFFALLTVLGVFVHRKRFPNAERPYKTWGYPFTPLIFCILIISSIVYMIHSDYVRTFVDHSQPVMWMTLMSAATLLAGIAVYALNRFLEKK